jgi:hypothetical protein
MAPVAKRNEILDRVGSTITKVDLVMAFKLAKVWACPLAEAVAAKDSVAQLAPIGWVAILLMDSRPRRLRAPFVPFRHATPAAL